MTKSATPPGGWRIPLSSPSIDSQDVAAVEAVLVGGRLASGPAIEQFETVSSESLGRPSVLCSSGTAGLVLALRALGVTGGEVITPALGFIATAHAIRAVGATPRFCDVDPQTLCAGIEQLEAAWSPDVSAVIPVDLLGVPAPMTDIMTLAAGRDVPVIEDACEALGSSMDGVACGTAADAGVFGFYPNKIITMGEGGLVACRDESLAARVRQLANQGRSGAGFCFDGEGYNFRITEMQAALGTSQWRRLDDFIEARQHIAGRYLEGLQGLAGIDPTPAPVLAGPGNRRSWFAFIVLVEDSAWRDPLSHKLAAAGIETGLYFPSITDFSPYDQAPSAPLPVTSELSPRMLALPFHSGLGLDRVDEVVSVVGESLDQIRTDG